MSRKEKLDQLRVRSMSSAKIAAKRASGFGDKAATWLFTGSYGASRPKTALDEIVNQTGRSRRNEASLVSVCSASDTFVMVTVYNIGQTSRRGH